MTAPIKALHWIDLDFALTQRLAMPGRISVF
jgi:hypothetical protein